MTVNKGKLTAIMFVLAMISTVSAYAGEGSDTLSFSDEHGKIMEKVKECIGLKDIRIVRTKDFEMMQKWVNAESRNKDRDVTQSHDSTTMGQVMKIGGVFLGISLPKSKVPKKTEESAEYQKAQANMFHKIENCLAREAKDIRIVETKDKKIIDEWFNAEEKEDNDNIDMYISITHSKNMITGVSSFKSKVK